MRTLGLLALESNGERVPGLAAQRKRLALLALLAVAGDTGLARDKILAYLWPEADEDRARNTLYQFVHGLRRALGDVILTGTGDLKLNAELITSDVTQFRSALRAGEFKAAAAVYQGPFLDGVYLREAPEFDRWVEVQRAAYADDHARAIESIAVRAAELGDSVERLYWWRQRVTADPFSSRVAVAYMEALWMAGERIAALRHADVYAALIRNELSIDPDQAVQQYADQLAKRSVPVLPQPDVAVTLPAPDITAATGDGERTAATGRRAANDFSQRQLLVGVIGLLLVSTVVALSFLWRPHVRAGLVIVAPFENQSGDAALDILRSVIASSLTQSLAATGRLSVANLPEIGPSVHAASGNVTESANSRIIRQSGAQWVVAGRFRFRGDSLVVDSRIIGSNKAEVIAALDPVVVRRADRDQLFEQLRQRVLGAVAALHDAAGESWVTSTGKLPRYDAELEYTLGLEAGRLHNTDVALEHFRQAASLDTGFFAPTFAMWSLGSHLPDSALRSLDARRDRLSATEQLDLEVMDAEAHDDVEGAYQAIERRVARTPDDPVALLTLAYEAYTTNRYARAIMALHSVRQFPAWLAGAYVRDINAHHMAGDFASALAEAEEGRARDPRTWMYCLKAMEQHAARGNVAAADSVIASCAGVPDQPPDPGFPYWMMGHELLVHGYPAQADTVLARCIAVRLDYGRRHPDGSGGRARLASQCYFDRADWPNAYRLLRTEFARYPNTDLGHMMFGIAAAHVGDTVAATNMLHWHAQLTPSNSDHLWYRAGILVALDRRDDAIELLRKAVKGGSPAVMTHINNVRAFLPLRGDPRFEALIAPRH